MPEGVGYSFEQLSAMGAQPIAPGTGTPGSGGGLTYEDLIQKGFVPVDGSAPSPAPVSKLESFGRGVAQGATLGFADEITGAIESLFSDKSYTQSRDESRAAYTAAEQANPLTSMAGNLGGSLATTIVPGLNVAKGAGMAGAVKTAALGGGLTGLGSSEADLTKGDFAGAIKDTVQAAVTGAAVGGVAHKVGQKLAGRAADKFDGDVIADAMGRSRPKDQLMVQAMAEADRPAARAILHSDDFRPVQKALRSKDTEKARTALDEYIAKVSDGREADWDELAKILPKNAGLQPGKILDRFENDIQRASTEHGQADVAKVLGTVKERLQSLWSTAGKGTAASHFEQAAAAAQGPESATLKAIANEIRAGADDLTGNDVWKIAERVAGSDGQVPPTIRNVIKDLPSFFNKEAKIHPIELRKALTNAQREAVAALGTIAETEHARLKAAPKLVFDKAMDEFLDGARVTSPDASKVVDRILDRNKKLSLSLSFQEGLEQRAKKELVGNQGLGAGLAAQAANVTKGAAVVGALATGNPAPLLGLAAPAMGRGVAAAGRRGNDLLARIMYQAEQGNPWAQRQIQALRQTPQGLARLAAVRNHQEEEPVNE